MRYKKIQIFALLLLFSCNTSTNGEKDSKEGLRNDKTEQFKEDWDKHQYFDDLEWTTLDSLNRVIELADSIVAFNWNGKDGNPANVYHHIVDAYGKFSNRVGKDFTLNDAQQISLKDLLTDSTNYKGDNAMCFIPHVAFVYYYESEIIGQSNICFLCSGIKSVPKSTTALSENGNRKLKAFCRDIGLEIIDDESKLSH